MKGVAVLLAAFGLSLLTSPAPGGAATRSSFEAFEGRADSYAAGLSSKQISAAPIPVEAFLTRTRTEINSQPRAQAYAGVVDVPLGELAGFFGAPMQLPNYCYADYPGEADNQCAGGAGVTHAEGDGFNLDATGAESRVAAARHSNQQLTIGASQSHSTSHIVDGVLRTATEVVLQQVTAGDALAFEELRSTAAASADGRPGSAQAVAAFTISGITVLGQRVPAPGPLDVSTVAHDVLAPLAGPLAERGITVQAISLPSTTTNPDGRQAEASVGGLLIESTEPATGNRVAYALSVARASAAAVPPGLPVEESSGADTGPLPPVAPPGLPPAAEAQSGTPGPDTTDAAPTTAGTGSGANGFTAVVGRSSGSSTTPSAGGPATSVSAGAVPAPGPSETAAPSSAMEFASSEVLGRRVADRLPLVYGLIAAAIAVLGLLAVRSAAGA